MTEDKKISAARAAALMLCFSSARLIAFRPEGDDLLICCAAELTAGLILWAVCALFSALPENKSPIFGKIFALSGAGYLMLLLTYTLSGFAASMQYSFPDFYTLPSVIAALAAAAAYCASMGMTGCTRTAVAAVILTAAVFFLTAVGAVRGFEVSHLSIAAAGRTEVFFRRTVQSLAYSAELPLMILLLRDRIEKPRRAGLIWLCVRTLTDTAVLALTLGVLGRRSGSGLPVFTLSAYSKTSMIERFDALVLLMWTLCTLLSAAALILGIRRCAEVFSARAGRCSGPLAAAVCAGAAILMTAGGQRNAPSALLAVLLPVGIAAGSFIGRRRV